MTIEGLLQALQPFYRDWNEEGERWHLFATPGKRQLSVSIVSDVDADEGVTTYDDGYWRLGIGPNSPVMEIATVRLDADGLVCALEADSTAQFNWIKPMIAAVDQIENLRNVWM